MMLLLRSPGIAKVYQSVGMATTYPGKFLEKSRPEPGIKPAPTTRGTWQKSLIKIKVVTTSSLGDKVAR